jgi:WD40 repeat protein
MIGTLPYMSPEQVAADPDQIDTRTDVYALGVVMFELLTGKLPHDVRNRPIPEAARVIRDEEPTRLGSLRRELGGEIETIVARAMEKDKSRRYASAAELAADIRRYLAGEPIWAKRDSAFYVIGKTLARRKGVAALLFVVVALVVGFGVYAGVEASRFRDKAYEESLAVERADSALKLARAESARNEGLTKRMEEQLAASQIDRGRLEATAENPAAAERFLWTALINNPDEPGAWWGLRELYGRYPCEWDARFPVWLTGVSCRNGLAAICDRVGGLRVLATDTGAILAEKPGTLASGRDGAVCVAFAADDLIICFYYDGAARAFSYEPGKLTEVWQWQAHRGTVISCRMMPGGDAIASAGLDGAVRIWSLPGLALETTIKCGGTPLALAVSPDGGRIGVGFGDGTVGVWARTGGPQLRRIEHSDSPVSALLFSRDGESVLCGGSDRRVDGWRLSDGARLPGLGITNGELRGLEFAPTADSRQDSADKIAVLGGLGVRVATQSPTPQSRMLGYSAPGFMDSSWSGDRLITVTIDGHTRCWDTRPQPSQTALGGQRNWIFSAEFSPDGKRLAVTGGIGVIRMYDVTNGFGLLWERAMDGTDPAQAKGRIPRLRMLRWINNDQYATGGSDGLVRFQNASDGAMTGWFKAAAGEIFGLAVSADGSRIATVATDRAMRVWNAATKALDWEATGMQTYGRGVAFSPDGTKVYSGGSTQGVIEWNMATHKQVRVLPTSSQPWAIAASPDGLRLGVGTMEAGVDIIELATATRIGGPSGHLRVVAGAVFSPDSKLLFTGGDDGTVKVWEPAHARLLSSIEGNLGEVPSVGISPDGRYLVYGCQGRTAVVRDLYYHDAQIANGLEGAIAAYGRTAPAENLAKLREWAEQQQSSVAVPTSASRD